MPVKGDFVARIKSGSITEKTRTINLHRRPPPALLTKNRFTGINIKEDFMKFNFEIISIITKRDTVH
ncbi:MAG: hypothetical protein ACR2L1_02085 [Pyrinomonadaceae bacterium]